MTLGLITGLVTGPASFLVVCCADSLRLFGKRLRVFLMGAAVGFMLLVAVAVAVVFWVRGMDE